MYVQNFSVYNLLDMKARAASVTDQFPLRSAKVKQIISSIKKHNQFLSTFTVAELDDELYLVGGRHRLQALLTIIQDEGTVLEADGDDLAFPAVVHEVECKADIVLLTQFDNDSRSMPPAEKQYLGFSFEQQLDGDDYAVNNVSRLRTAYLYLDLKHNSLNTNTVRQIWGAVVASLSKADKKLLTTNEEALLSFGTRFEELLVPAVKSTSTPARNYKKVAEHILLAGLTGILEGFDVVHKQRLTKQDKEDVAILGAALERSLNSDKIDEARGIKQRERIVFDAVRAEAELAGTDEDTVPF